jgi:hypothetical protein
MRSLSRSWRAPLLAMLIALGTAAPASADVSPISIDESGTLSPGRQAVVLTGSIACNPGDTLSLSARVIQGTRSGFGGIVSTPCTTESQDWTIVVTTGSSLFHRGRASAGISVQTCNFPVGCTTTQLDRFITVS